MRITSFTVRNFKGIGEEGVTIYFAPVTLLFGANNSGKSSAIHALFLAREIICNGNLNPDTVEGGGNSICLGGFNNFVHNHDLTKSVQFRFDFNIINELRFVISNLDYHEEIAFWNEPSVNYADIFLGNVLKNIKNISYEFSISWDIALNKPYISNRSIYINDKQFMSVNSNINDNVATAMFTCDHGDLFDTSYDGGIIDQQYYTNFIKPKLMHPSFDDFSIEIDNSEDGNINEVISKKLDYNLYSSCHIFVSNKTTLEIYDFVSTYLCYFFTDNNSSLAIDEIINKAKNLSINSKRFLFSDFRELNELILGEKYIDNLKKYNLESREKSDAEISDFFNQLTIDSFSDFHFDVNLHNNNIKYCGNLILNKSYNYIKILLEHFLGTVFFMPIDYLNEFLSKTLYIGTQRVTIDRHFNPENIQALSWANGMAAWQYLMDDPALVIKVNNEIKKVMGKDFDLQLAILNDISIDINKFVIMLNQLKNQPGSITSEQMTRILASTGVDMHNRIFFVNQSGTYLSPNDLGHGISQIIPILTAPLLDENDCNMVVIEEPESNIHPAWQVELAEYFLRASFQNNEDSDKQSCAQEAINRPFILLETHSEHIMLRILRRIRETHENELPEGAQPAYPENVAVHFIQKDSNFVTKCNCMQVTKDGDFKDRWPKGFFEERAKELF